MVLNLQRKSWSALSRKVSAGKPCGALKHGWVLRYSKRGLNGSGHSQVKGVRDSGERLSGEGLHGEGLGDERLRGNEGLGDEKFASNHGNLEHLEHLPQKPQQNKAFSRCPNENEYEHLEHLDEDFDERLGDEKFREDDQDDHTSLRLNEVFITNLSSNLSSGDVREFVEACCVRDEGAVTPTALLLRAYLAWCNTNNLSPQVKTPVKFAVLWLCCTIQKRPKYASFQRF